LIPRTSELAGEEYEEATAVALVVSVGASHESWKPPVTWPGTFPGQPADFGLQRNDKDSRQLQSMAGAEGLMISLTINGTEIGLEDRSSIAQQVDRRRADGARVCVKVRIDEGGVCMVLSTLDCPSDGGANRRPKPAEERIFSLWEKVGLIKESFAGGQVLAFLKQLPALLP
jgi:hypothetical protein